MKKQMIDLKAEKAKTNCFIKLFDEKIKALEGKIKSSNDNLERVSFEITKFYTEEESQAAKDHIRLYSKDAKTIIKDRIKRYEIILGLLTEKYSVIRDRLKDGYYTDSLEKANMKLELFNLQIEINSKQDWIEKYNERKKVYNR